MNEAGIGMGPRASMRSMRSSQAMQGRQAIRRGWLAALGFWAACGGANPGATPAPQASSNVPVEAAKCPQEALPSQRAPGTTPAHENAAAWVDAATGENVLLSAEDIDLLNDRLSEVVGGWRDLDASVVGKRDAVNASIAERMKYLGREVEAGRLVESETGAFLAAQAVVEGLSAVDHQRLVLREAPLHCIPLHGGVFKVPIDRDFDRNACASLHPGERVRVLGRGPQGNWLYVHAGHTVGWLHDASLTRRLNQDQIDAWRSPDRLVPLRDDVTTDSGMRVRLGVSLPLLESPIEGGDEGFKVLAPSSEGLIETRIAADAAVHVGYPALTRQRLFDIAFSELGDPYGWGGREGERDCSRLLRDLFATFGVQLARHSGVQAKMGVRTVDVSEMSLEDKRIAIAKAAKGGVVLLYMKGHIMLYLGREGPTDYAISAISEYLEPCEGGDPTTYRIDRVAVTTLMLGEGTERTSFIERIATLVVFEPPPATE